MSCMGTDPAISPAILTSAMTIAPQVYMPALGNTSHSNDGPAEVVTCGSARLIADENNRNPVDPVSTCTPFTVWQVVVPGIHTVTLAERMLTELFPLFTVTGSRL